MNDIVEELREEILRSEDYAIEMVDINMIKKAIDEILTLRENLNACLGTEEKK